MTVEQKIMYITTSQYAISILTQLHSPLMMQQQIQRNGNGTEIDVHLSGSELLGKPVSEVLEWLFPLFDDLTQLLCKRDDVETVF